MRRRHPPGQPVVPRLWLMTDERIKDVLVAARKLPRGSGIVFRHHATPAWDRRRLFARLRRIALARGLVLLRAGTTPLPGEMGVHGGRGAGLRTWPVHDRAELRRAIRAKADAVFVSPLFATRSHPGQRPLGPRAAALLARGFAGPVIALGGMDARRFARIRSRGFHGWAAIDALSRDVQKRKAVPRYTAWLSCRLSFVWVRRSRSVR